MPSFRLARLTPQQLESVRDLEQTLGPDTVLLAVERRQEAYKLEAKAADGTWHPPSHVFPEIGDESFLFETKEQAQNAKRRLKGLLRQLAPRAKGPIRIQPLFWATEAEPDQESDASPGPEG